MRKQARSGRVDKKLPGHDLLPAKIQALFEMFGHYGGWSAQEFAEFEASKGTVVHQERTRPEPPPEVAELRVSADAATIAYQVADGEWRAAVLERRALEAKASEIMVDRLTGQIISPISRAEMSAADARIKQLLDDREEASRQLRKVNGRYNKAHRAWQHELTRLRVQAAR